MDKIEKVKKILEAYSWNEHGYNVMPTSSFGRVAEKICQLFPKTADNPDGYKPKPKTKGDEHPEEYKPSGDDSMTEKEEERFNKIVSQLGKKPNETLYKQFPTKKRRKEVKCEPYE